MNIVKIHNDEPRAGTKIIADGFDRKHKNIVELIEKHRIDFEDFGGLKRQKLRSTGGRKIEEFLLNEDQAMFLGALLRNSEIVVKFKKNLVKEFSKVRKQLLNLQSSKQDQTYQLTRSKGKLVRRETTDTMKAFVQYATSRGSTQAFRYYNTLTTMVNSALFVVEGKFKNLRESMSTKQLMTVATVEQIVDRALQEGMSDNLQYRDIFQLAKSRVIQFAALYGKTDVIEKAIEHHSQDAVAA